MIYSLAISTPANTAKTALKRTGLHVTKGLIYKIEIDFPPGSAGLMGVAVFDGSYCIWPSNVTEFFTGDDTEVDFDDLYLKEAAPYVLDIYTYNTDDTYAHTVNVRLGLVSKKAYMARFMPDLAWEEFAKLLQQLRKEQNAAVEKQAEEIAETPFAYLVEGVT